MRPGNLTNAATSRAKPVAVRAGATLIELLVVVALISLLVTILIPSLGRSMQMAAATVCKHNMREVYHGLFTYRVENDGWLPMVAPQADTFVRFRRPDPWFLKLYPTYMPDPAILGCPEDPFRFRLQRIGNSSSFAEEVRADYSSYGLNSFIMMAGGGKLADLDRHEPTRPHDTILMADIGPDEARGRSAMVAGGIGPERNYSLLSWDDGFDPFTGRSTNPWLTRRHDRGVHMLTLTGGVREVRTTDLMESSLRRYYADCAAGGCTLCKELRLVHYSFAQDSLFWWTGPAPTD